MTVRFSGFHGTSQLDGITKQQQFFRHRSLTRVWVRNDGKGSTLLNLLEKFGTHKTWVLKIEPPPQKRPCSQHYVGLEAAHVNKSSLKALNKANVLPEDLQVNNAAG